MHIPEGFLSGTPGGIGVLAAGAAVAATGTAIGLRKIDYEQMPRVAMLSAAFFVASLVHVPLGGTSVHLVLNGLVGLILGWAAFPAILIALFLQAVFFGFGGVTTLGLNTVTMALPAVAAYYLFHRARARPAIPWPSGPGFRPGLSPPLPARRCSPPPSSPRARASAASPRHSSSSTCPWPGPRAW